MGRVAQLAWISIFVSGACLWGSCGGAGVPQGGQRAGQAAPAGNAPPQTVFIDIEEGATGLGPLAFGINPYPVAPGTIVTWRNRDSIPHTVTSDTRMWNSGTLGPGDAFSYRFDSPGTFSYSCLLHGGERGTIVVQ